MNELDFTIELNSASLSDQLEAEMLAEADRFLRDLALKNNDLTGAAVNIRQPVRAETAYIYEVTVVVYARPDHVAATKKQADPMMALKETLNAVERQVRKKREKLRERWEQPGNKPTESEITEIVAAEGQSQKGS